jgi:hypothetical protein
MPVELGVGAGGALLVLEADPARRCHDPESTPPACTSGTRLAPKLIFLKIQIPSDLVGQVFTFGRDLLKEPMITGLPTG